ncbi:MAG: hypothetical protein U0361_25200 [Nitrospiraceae bacterium]
MTHTIEDGEERVYLTHYASIESYFTDDGEGGVALTVVPGFCAYPPEFERNKDGVRDAVVADVARRLGVPSTDLMSQPFRSLKAICAPELPEHYRYARRARGANRWRTTQ